MTPVPAPMPPTPTTSSPRSTPRRGAAAVGAIVIVDSGDEQTAEAAVRTAAGPAPGEAPQRGEAGEALDDVTSFEAVVTERGGDFAELTARLRVAGDDFEVVLDSREEDGRTEHSVITLVDCVQYLVIEGGRPERTTVAPGEGLDSPYGRLSDALLAALDGADVTEAGPEVVAGVDTDRYDITLTDRSVAALSALAPELPGFDDPQSVERMSVWVADGRVHRFDVAFDDGRTLATTFSNLNGEITITPPPGPYVEDAPED